MSTPMRHLYGGAMAVALAAAVFFGGTWGFLRVTRTMLPVGTNGLPANGGSLIHYHNILSGGGAMLAVGLAIGLVMVIPWVSPLASGLPGLVLMAWSGLYLFDVKDAFRLIPLKTHVYGAGFEVLLTSGLLAMLGIAMVIPLFIPSRWVRRVRRETAESTLVAPEVGTIYEETMAGFPSSSTGSNVVTAWDQPTQTQPVGGQGPITPPGGSRAPWDTTGR